MLCNMFTRASDNLKSEDTKARESNIWLLERYITGTLPEHSNLLCPSTSWAVSMYYHLLLNLVIVELKTWF